MTDRFPWTRALGRRLASVPSHPVWSAVVVPFLGHRLILFVVVGFAYQLVHPIDGWRALPTLPFLDPWLRWDSSYYLMIADQGYGQPGLSNPAAFFPLYPALIRLVATFMPWGVAALVVSNLAALGGLTGLYYLCREIGEERVARRAVWVAILFPFSFYLSAAYSESVFLCALGALLVAWYRRRYRWAALAVAAAVLARPVGMFCATVPFFVGWLVYDRRWSKLPWFTLTVVPALAVLMGAHFLATGHPLDFLFGGTSMLGFRLEAAASSDDVRDLAWYFRLLYDEGVGVNLVRRLLSWSALVLITAASVWLFRLRHLELALVCVLAVGVPLALQASLLDVFALGRYALVAVPMFIPLAHWTGEGNRQTILFTGGATLQAILASLFGAWYWIE